MADAPRLVSNITFIASDSSATVFFSMGVALSPFLGGFEGLRLGNLMWDEILLVSSFHICRNMR